MDERYWDSLAARYDEEIFNPLEFDRNGTIARVIGALGSGDATASDYGCGIGAWLPILTEHFARVCAIDVSNEMLRIASERNEALDNVEYRRRDLSRPRSAGKKCDAAFGFNLLIMPSARRRLSVLRAIRRDLAPGGSLLLLVPSLESRLYVHSRWAQWCRRLGLQPESELAKERTRRVKRLESIRDGIALCGGEPTKHYLREEMEVLLGRAGFKAGEIEKVEYPWTTEFEEPPGWMREPWPWDWLVTATKRGERAT